MYIGRDKTYFKYAVFSNKEISVNHSTEKLLKIHYFVDFHGGKSLSLTKKKLIKYVSLNCVSHVLLFLKAIKNSEKEI